MLTPSRKWIVSLVLVLAASIVALSAFSDRFTDERVEEWRQLLKSPISCPQVVYEGDGVSIDAELVEESAAARVEDCTICSVAADLCESLGESKVLASQAYIGTGERIRRFLAKARTGDGFTIGVVGGSVSYGHGLYEADNRHSPKLVHRIIFDHLNALFPARGGVSMGTYEAGKNSFVNGALGATGSDYFSYCFGNHIPEETDLVLVEQGINDFMSKGSYETYELLLRGLLDMPNQPAILNLKVFALLFEHMGLGGEVHLGAAQFYDVPTVSLMNVLLHDILRNDSLVEEYFTWMPDGPDVRHIGPRGHKILGDLATAYIDTQLCEIKKRGQEGWTVADYHVEPMPRLRLMDHYVKDVVTPRLAPTCLSTNAKGKAHLEPLRSEGWREWAWKEKNYLVADKPGSTIEFAFSTAIGNVDLYFLRSKEFGLGNVRCWVDDDRDKAVKLEGYWTLGSNVGQRARIAGGLEVGQHTLHCELLDETKDPNGGKEFRIISLMSM